MTFGWGRRTIAMVVVICFLGTGCASIQQGNSGDAAMACGAGGLAAGAAIGAAIGAHQDWKAALVGAAIGAIAGGVIAATTCFAIAEYRSRQVKDYQQTREAIAYEPSQGEAVQITYYKLAPAAVAPDSTVEFNATYHVMTPNPNEDVVVTETRIVKVQDAKTGQYRELGRSPYQITVKPGTRQASGKFTVSSRSAGGYLIVFEVTKGPRSDSRELALLVSPDRAVVASASGRVSEFVAEPAKAPATSGPPVALATLGEQQPAPPTIFAAVSAPVGDSAKVARNVVFIASKITGATGHLREGPGTQHRVVGSVRPGDRFPIVERGPAGDGGSPWFKIRLESGREAWVDGSVGVEQEE